MSRRAISIGVGAAVAAIVLVLVLSGGSHRPGGVATASAGRTQAAGSVRPAPASLSVGSLRRLAAVPNSFLGFSTEYWTLPIYERYLALYARVLSLIHVIGDGPLVLRIGGDSSDHTFFDPRIRKLPHWAFELTPAFVTRTAAIVRSLGLHVILDLNLVTGSPQLAAAWAEEAVDAMPHSSIIGFEIGNEPDLYDRAFWLFTTGGERFSGRALPLDITPTSYVLDYDRYARVLARTAPHVPLLAPALANPHLDLRWIATLLKGRHPGLGVISAHRYPYSGCVLRGSPAYPTIGRVLSESATVGMAQSVEPAVRLAHRAGLPFRLTEFNSVTCSGLPAVSNAFATALWAPDAIFELMRAGIQAVDLHAREYAINDPFTFDANGLVARPLLYGLVLFARTLGPHARVVQVKLHASASLHLKTWAVLSGARTLRVLMIDKGPRPARVTLALPATVRGSLERLLAPSPRAIVGERLGGQWLDHNGAWQGTPVSETVIPRAHRYTVTVPRYSAALLSVSLAEATSARLVARTPNTRTTQPGAGR